MSKLWHHYNSKQHSGKKNSIYTTYNNIKDIFFNLCPEFITISTDGNIIVWGERKCVFMFENTLACSEERDMYMQWEPVYIRLTPTTGYLQSAGHLISSLYTWAGWSRRWQGRVETCRLTCWVRLRWRRSCCWNYCWSCCGIKARQQLGPAPPWNSK